MKSLENDIWRKVGCLSDCLQAYKKAKKAYDEADVPFSNYTIMPRIADTCKSTAASKAYGRLLAAATLLALYEPRALVGAKIGNNIRKKIARAIGCTPTYVSKVKCNIFFLYKTNMQLHADLDEAAMRAETIIKEDDNTGND